ncbi:SusC/RagA family TonB-linked outer membrane protein [Hymenobacter sp. IS2118]|uniref:SusC/RagA family TonB-linked outer membrane protein n=1 Tax=Hymenobacter sp. IS2118 TaxID=1505605 RepID=UPI000553C8D7|nr:SusC/RagA family TonB-linked outer membrane protein [Hymenobacter sp. IS2118]
MKKSLLLVFALFMALLQQVQAQDRTISGKVTDRSTNQGLPGVTVLAKGTTVGTSTNADGGYTLTVPATANALVFSFIGYASQESAIGNASSINITLATDSKQLNEVVVTALGVERNRNTLAFSATQIDGSDITVARNPNPINGLSGKVAGLAITQSNTLGGSSNVVIRGTKSLFGNNQALFVVDGVPISNLNSNGTAQQTGGSGYDYGNAASDINPDDIASTTVLKGAAATALYGERAANGVILITTKKGRKGLNVTVNTGVTAARIDKSTFIKYQKEYGGGYLQAFRTAADGSKVVRTGDDASYGPKFDPALQVKQWDAFTLGSPTFGQARPWVAADSGPEDFFETGVSTLNSLSLDGGNDNGTFKLGYINDVQRGVLPNSKITKDIVNFGGSLNLTPKLTTSASVNFTRIKGLGRYGTGYGSENLMSNFRQWWPVNVDISEQEDAYNRNQSNATWNFANPVTNRFNAIYWNNPYFTRFANFENDTRFRTFGNVSATYKLADWFNIVGRVSLDTYDEQQEERSAVGSTTVSYLPYYSRFNATYRESNYDLLGNFKFQLNDAFSFAGLIGTNVNRIRRESIFASTNGGLVVPGLYSLSNTQDPLTPPIENLSQIGRDGVFASTTFGFRDRVYLDLTVRRDKSTTLPTANNSYVYPSAAINYVFSEDLKEKATWLSYGKVRANYAQVGAGARALAVNDVYAKPTAFGSIPLFSLPATKNNPDLKSEQTRSGEIGIEAAFLDSRIGFDVTGYQSNSFDQIIPVNISTATGYDSRFVNSGEIRNRGVEIAAFVVPVKTASFNWRVSANYTRNRNEVLSLYDGVTSVELASYQGGVSSNLTVGRPTGMLRGTDYVYHENGQRIIDQETGIYATTSADAEIGDPNADWRGGLTNALTFKNVSLSFLIDVKSGGDVFSLDRYYGLSSGLQPETVGLNDLGNPSRNSIATGGGIILPGVAEDGTANTIRIENNGNQAPYGYGGNPNAGFVYDASFVKLREVNLSYSLPSALVTRFGFVKGVDLSIIGRNLWIIHKNLPDADPEEGLSSGNLGQGYQSGSYPTARTVGANIRFSF